MAGMMSEEEIYEEARKRVKAKREFFSHLAAYVAVNVLLIIIWAVTGAGFPWFLFPLCGWGIGLFFHYMNTFVFTARLDKTAIEKEAEKIRREQR
jgi:hypothetical protein